MSLYRNLMRGAGFFTSLQQHSVQDDIATGIGEPSLTEPNAAPPSLSSAVVPWSLPAVNFLAGENQAYQQALVKVALPSDRDRMRAYLSKVNLGMAVITGVSCLLCSGLFVHF